MATEDELAREGYTFLDAKPKNALHCFERALAIDPTHSASLKGKGLCLLLKDDYKTAFIFLSKALRYLPKDITILNSLSAICLKEECLTETLEYASRVLSQDPKNQLAISYKNAVVSFYVKTGLEYLENSEFVLAKTSFKEAINIDENNVQAVNGLAIIHFKNSYYTKALKCLDQILDVDPKHASTLSNKGEVLFYQGHYKQAAKCFKGIPDDGMDYPLSRFYLGFTAFFNEPDPIEEKNKTQDTNQHLKIAQNIFDTLIKECESVLKHTLIFSFAKIGRGMICYKEGDQNSAANLFAEAYRPFLNKDAYYYSIYIIQGIGFTSIKSANDKALECFNTVLEKYPYSIDALIQKGRILLHQDNLAQQHEAKRVLENALNLSPRNEDILKLLQAFHPPNLQPPARRNRERVEPEFKQSEELTVDFTQAIQEAALSSAVEDPSPWAKAAPSPSTPHFCVPGAIADSVATTDRSPISDRTTQQQDDKSARYSVETEENQIRKKFSCVIL